MTITLNDTSEESLLPSCRRTGVGRVAIRVLKTRLYHRDASHLPYPSAFHLSKNIWLYRRWTCLVHIFPTSVKGQRTILERAFLCFGYLWLIGGVKRGRWALKVQLSLGSTNSATTDKDTALQLNHIPTVGTTFPIISYLGTIRYLFDAKTIVDEGIKKVSGSQDIRQASLIASLVAG